MGHARWGSYVRLLALAILAMCSFACATRGGSSESAAAAQIHSADVQRVLKHRIDGPVQMGNQPAATLLDLLSVEGRFSYEADDEFLSRHITFSQRSPTIENLIRSDRSHDKNAI